MTDKEKAIVMAFSGTCMLTGDKFNIFHEYVEKLMGRPVYTHELGFLADEIKEKAKDDFIELCKADAEQTRWIPISERLPEDGTWNIFTDGKHISIERYKSDAIDHFFPNGRWFSFEEAVAWMPLPERYTESEEKV
jgi:Protein of unknown function (DUF551).